MLKQRFLIYTFFVTSAVGLEAFGQPTKPTQKPVKMEKTEQNYVMKFTDGREAQVFYQLGSQVVGSIDMRQIENTCEPQRQLVRCQMDFDLRPYKISLLWTKHPDATKLNKVVIASTKIGESFIDQPVEGSVNTLSWFFMHTSKAQNHLNLRNDRIRCDNFNWLMQTESAPETVFIQSWGAEAMIVNEETKISENLTFLGAKGLTLRKTNDNLYYVENFRLFYPGDVPTNFPTYISAQVVNLTFRSPHHGRTCQVSFEMNAGKIISLISSQAYNKLAPEMILSGLEYWQYSDFTVPGLIRAILTGPSTEVK